MLSIEDSCLREKQLNFLVKKIKELFAKNKARYCHLDLNYHDWEDWQQEITIHIFKNLNKYDNSRPIYNWINFIIRNQLKNKIRDRYKFGTKNPILKYRYYQFMHPTKLCTKIKNIDEAGNFEVKWEPDLIDETESLKSIPYKEVINYCNNHPIYKKHFTQYFQSKGNAQYTKDNKCHSEFYNIKRECIKEIKNAKFLTFS